MCMDYVCRFAGGIEVDPESNGSATSDRPSRSFRHFDVRHYRP